MANPIWIKLDDGEIFEGHQLHWANCFFSNATKAIIEQVCSDNSLFPGHTVKLEIREMTEEEVQKYPEAVEFEKELIQEYGEK